jgi:ribonuclease J
VLSSHPIPGNEETVHRTINGLFQRGAQVIYDEIAPVHVSGHASEEEIKLLIKLVQPEYVIPIHGELRHLKRHGDLAREVGIPEDHIAVVENGTVIELRKGKLEIGERIPGGYVFVDGSMVGDVGRKVLRERESLARDGFVAIHIQLHAKSGKLRGDPQIISRGFVFTPDAMDLFARAGQRIREVISENKDNELEIRVEKELRKFFYAETRRRPMVFVFITDNS